MLTDDQKRRGLTEYPMTDRLLQAIKAGWQEVHGYNYGSVHIPLELVQTEAPELAAAVAPRPDRSRPYVNMPTYGVRATYQQAADMVIFEC